MRAFWQIADSLSFFDATGFPDGGSKPDGNVGATITGFCMPLFPYWETPLWAKHISFIFNRLSSIVNAWTINFTGRQQERCVKRNRATLSPFFAPTLNTSGTYRGVKGLQFPWILCKVAWSHNLSLADAQSQSRLDLILRLFEYDTDQMIDVEKVGLAMFHQILSSF